MIKVSRYKFGSKDYISNIASPYNKYYSTEEPISKYIAEPYVVMINKEFPFCNYEECPSKIYIEIINKIKNTFNPSDDFYFLEESFFKKETRLTNYFRLWNELKRTGVDLTFFAKTNCSDEVKYTYPNKLVYRALCRFQWQNIDDYFTHYKNYFSSCFFYSKRDFDLNCELKKMVEDYSENNYFGLWFCIKNFVENDDLLFIVYGDYHVRSFGINIIGNKKMIDELYEKVLKCFENEK